MKKVVTFGVFDCFHYGHLRLIERCKRLGDYLIVAVQDDKNSIKNKPGVCLFYNENQRLEIVSSLKSVDQAILYTQIDETLKEIDFDVLVVGPDQTNEHFKRAFDYCGNHNKKVVILSRTPGISSTLIRTKD